MDEPQERLLTIRSAAERLGLGIESMRYLVKSGQFHIAVKGVRGGQCTLLTEASVDEYWRLKSHKRLQRTKRRNNAYREYAWVSEARSHVLPTKAAAKFLGVNPRTVILRAQKGDLTTYRERENLRLTYYAIDELRDIADQRAVERDRPRKIKQPRASHLMRTIYPCESTVEYEHLRPWEQNFSNFSPYFTLRQVTFLLRISVHGLADLRRKGRLPGYLMENQLGFGRPMYYYLCEDVDRLRNDATYWRHSRAAWEGVHASRMKRTSVEEEYVPRRQAN